jgi:hypothetical protein
MKKFDRTKVIVIVSILFGILGYFYIMVFMSPGIFEVLALIFFSFIISVSSAFLFNEDFKGINISDGIRKRFDEIARALDTLTPFIITLSLFYFMNR